VKPLYVRQSRCLDTALEQLVSERMRPGELIFQWTALRDDGTVTVCLIEAEVSREHAEMSQIMGGLCAGGGRTLVFERVNNDWCFLEESEWVS